jgi:hypothetical protein
MMKQVTVTALAVLLVVVGSYVVLAQPAHPEGGCRLEECPVCRMTAEMMTQKALFVTQDMGVVVLAGDRLMRFDAGLNKIGEAEIGLDLDQLERRIMQRLRDCPMHRPGARMPPVTMGQELLPAPAPAQSSE